MKYQSITMVLLASVLGDVSAATYYVKPNGSDSATGTSHAKAWKTLKKVSSTKFNAGDDIYFLAGGKWNKQSLSVKTPGLPGNHSVIGSYYMKNGKETIGVPEGASKPTFIGAYPLVKNPNAVPKGPYTGLIHISASHVTVQNMRVEKSSGGGIIAEKKIKKIAYPITDIIIENNEVFNPAGNLLLAKNKTSKVIIRNNVMRGCATAYTNGHWVARNNNHPICSGFNNSSNGLMENNYVYEGDGEGIVSFFGGGNNVIRGNIVASNRFLGIYIDGSPNNTVENNIIIGNPGDNDKKDGYSAGAINVNVEFHEGRESDSTGTIIRNNLIANTVSCIGLNIAKDSRNSTPPRKIGFQVIGNTCIATKRSIGLKANVPASIEKSSVIANNIFFDADDGANACDVKGQNSPTKNYVFKNNLWQTQPANKHCRGAGDIYGDPQLSKKTGWRLTGPKNIPTANDFTPAASSNVIGAGSSVAGLTTDFNGNKRPAKPSIGAIEMSSTGSGSAVSIPYYMNIAGGQFKSRKTGKVYLKEQYRVTRNANQGSKRSTSSPIKRTRDDKLYQTWSDNGVMRWSIPVNNGQYAVTLLYQEPIWGVTKGGSNGCTSAGSSRQFDVTIEGKKRRNEYDICKDAGAPLTAIQDVISNISVTDGKLDIKLSRGQGVDRKPVLMGLEVTASGS